MNKFEYDANWWKERRARFHIPDPVPPRHPSVLPSEDLAAHQLLVYEYYASFNPASPEERSFVDDIIYCEWILRRLVRVETELFLYLHEQASTIHPDFPLGQVAAHHAQLLNALHWRAISTRKALKDAIDGLRDLRLHPIPDAEPPATPTIEEPLPEIGFVLETHEPNATPSSHSETVVGRTPPWRMPASAFRPRMSLERFHCKL